MNTLLEEPPVETAPMELPVETPPARPAEAHVELPVELLEVAPDDSEPVLGRALKGFLVALVVLLVLGAAVVGLLSSITPC